MSLVNLWMSSAESFPLVVLVQNVHILVKLVCKLGSQIHNFLMSVLVAGVDEGPCVVLPSGIVSSARSMARGRLL